MRVAHAYYSEHDLDICSHHDSLTHRVVQRSTHLIKDGGTLMTTNQSITTDHSGQSVCTRDPTKGTSLTSKPRGCWLLSLLPLTRVFGAADSSDSSDDNPGSGPQAEVRELHEAEAPPRT